jgi:hypothetical protein
MRQTMRTTFAAIGLPVLCVLAAGCEPRETMVYIVDGPQTVELIPTASETSVEQGASVVLSVQRRTTGNWRQVPLSQARGRCWVYRPPAEYEPEVAHSLQWIVDPEGSVDFSREYRFDQARTATMLVKGTITLTPVSEVTCEPDRKVEGPPLTIEVR